MTSPFPGAILTDLSRMTSAARRRLQALSKQLKEGIPDEGTFENIPKIRHVVEGSTEQRVKGKVVVVTGDN